MLIEQKPVWCEEDAKSKPQYERFCLFRENALIHWELFFRRRLAWGPDDYQALEDLAGELPGLAIMGFDYEVRDYLSGALRTRDTVTREQWEKCEADYGLRRVCDSIRMKASGGLFPRPPGM